MSCSRERGPPTCAASPSSEMPNPFSITALEEDAAPQLGVNPSQVLGVDGDPVLVALTRPGDDTEAQLLHACFRSGADVLSRPRLLRPAVRVVSGASGGRSNPRGLCTAWRMRPSSGLDNERRFVRGWRSAYAGNRAGTAPPSQRRCPRRVDRPRIGAAESRRREPGDASTRAAPPVDAPASPPPTSARAPYPGIGNSSRKL